MEHRRLVCAVVATLVGGCSLLDLSGFSGGDPVDAGLGDASDSGGPDASADVDADASNRVHHLYVFGGTLTGSTANPVDEVWYAAIAPDGSLGEWKVGPKLPGVRLYAPAVVGDDFVALVSGQGTGGGEDEVFVGRIEGGLVTGWVSLIGANAPRRIRHGAVLRSGRVYVIGGTDETGTARTDIVGATLSAAGVGNWTQVGTLPEARSKAGVTAGPEALYVVGGENALQEGQATVLRSPFAADGTLEGFVTEDTLPSARQHSRPLVIGSKFSITGGGNSVEVLTYDVGPDGALSGRVSAPSLPVGRQLHAFTAYGNHVWVTGGIVAGLEPSADVFVADIAPNGALQGGWRAVRSLPTARGYHAAAAF